MLNYLKQVRAELKHVVFPDRRQAAWHTVIILIVSAMTGLIIAGLDYLFTTGVTRLISF